MQDPTLSKRYAVKSGSGFYKKSYDSFGGHWTSEEAKATTWATAAGAQKMADQQQEYARLLSRNADAICVVPVQRWVY